MSSGNRFKSKSFVALIAGTGVALAGVLTAWKMKKGKQKTFKSEQKLKKAHR